MSFRLKDNNIPSEFKANYLKPTSFSKLKFGSSSVTPLKNTEEEAVSYNLPADDSSDWEYKVVDGVKQRVYNVPGTGSDQGGTGIGYEESYAKLTPEQKVNFPTIKIWEEYVRGYHKDKNPGVEVVQEAETWTKPVTWREQNRANFEGKSKVDGKWKYDKDLDYNWESRYRSGYQGIEGGGFSEPRSYKTGGLKDAHGFVSNYGDDVVGDWDFDWTRNHRVTGNKLFDKDIGRYMNLNRMKYMRTYQNNLIASLNEGIQPGDENYITYSDLTQEQHDQIYERGKNEWFLKLKAMYPNVKWGSRGSTKLSGTSGEGPYKTVSVRKT